MYLYGFNIIFLSGEPRHSEETDTPMPSFNVQALLSEISENYPTLNGEGMFLCIFFYKL